MDVWLTYDEAARRLGIKPDSVRRRATARKWAKKPGNDGRTLVLIPSSALPEQAMAIGTDIPPVIATDIPPDIPMIHPEVSALREELASVKSALIGVQDRLKDAQADRDRLATLLEKALEPKDGFWARIFGHRSS